MIGIAEAEAKANKANKAKRAKAKAGAIDGLVVGGLIYSTTSRPNF